MDIDHDNHHLQIADSFLDMPSSSVTYDLANVLSNSPSQFTCDLTVAIESIPALEPIESMNTGMVQNDTHHVSSSTFESLNGIKRIRESTSDISCSSSSSYGTLPQENDDDGEGESDDGDEDYSPKRLQVTTTVTTGKSNNTKKKVVHRIRKRKMIAINRIYVCDWCHGRATFKSCQGLRFHKTLRCPERERKLGEDYFKCTKCKKAFVTRKGLNHHLVGSNHWPD